MRQVQQGFIFLRIRRPTFLMEAHLLQHGVICQNKPCWGTGSRDGRDFQQPVRLAAVKTMN